MLQAKTNGSFRSQRAMASAKSEHSRPPVSDVQVLLNTLLDYEATAKNNGINFGSGRFNMLTASECEYLKAELVADYIRLSAGNAGRTPGYYDVALASFCSKICDMQVPSNELMGTYLAAINVAYEQQPANKIPRFNEAVRRTMINVLQTCIGLMAGKAKCSKEGVVSASPHRTAALSA